MTQTLYEFAEKTVSNLAISTSIWLGMLLRRWNWDIHSALSLWASLVQVETMGLLSKSSFCGCKKVSAKMKHDSTSMAYTRSCAKEPNGMRPVTILKQTSNHCEH